jgi:hypothetical protein
MGSRDETSPRSTPEPSSRSSGRMQSAATNALYRVRDRVPRAFPSSTASMASSHLPAHHAVAADPARRGEVPINSHASQVYPGAYLPSPLQASVTTQRTVGTLPSSVGTPVPIGAYPPSPASANVTPRPAFSNDSVRSDTPIPIGAYPPSECGSEVPRSNPDIRGIHRLHPVRPSVVASRTLSHIRGDSLTPVGAYLPSDQNEDVPRDKINSNASGCRGANLSAAVPRHGVESPSIRTATPQPARTYPSSDQGSDIHDCGMTVSSQATLQTAPEYPAPSTVMPFADRVKGYRRFASMTDMFRGVHGHGGHSRQSFVSSISSNFSTASSIAPPPSSQTSQEFDARAPRTPPLVNTAAASQQAVSQTTAVPTVAPVQSPAAVPNVPGSAHYHFHGPVAVNNYTIHTEHERKPSMLKQVLTKGARLIEHQNGAGLDFKGVAEAANTIKSQTASWLGTGAARMKQTRSYAPTLIERHVDVPLAPVSEVAEVVEVDGTVFYGNSEEVGSVYCSTAGEWTAVLGESGSKSFDACVTPEDSTLQY